MQYPTPNGEINNGEIENSQCIQTTSAFPGLCFLNLQLFPNTELETVTRMETGFGSVVLGLVLKEVEDKNQAFFCLGTLSANGLQFRAAEHDIQGKYELWASSRDNEQLANICKGL